MQVETLCSKCGEDAILVEIQGKFFVRVCRSSKCKNYKPRQCNLSCRTEWLRESGAVAIHDWEMMQQQS